MGSSGGISWENSCLWEAVQGTQGWRLQPSTLQTLTVKRKGRNIPRLGFPGN